MINYFCKHCNIFYKEKGGDLLTCDHQSIPIINGVPRFVKNENYAERFGKQWIRFAATQLDSVSGLNISKERLERCLRPLSLTDLSGKSVLEVGCGAGRFTEVLLQYGAKVTSLDLSEAVNANISNFPKSDRHAVIQADAIEAPFQDESFDLVICLGVVQHAEDQDAILQALCRLCKPNGDVIFDHYRMTLSFLTRLLPLYRWLFLSLNMSNSVDFCQKLVKFLLPLHKRFGSSFVGYAVLSRVSPIVSYFHLFPTLSDKEQSEWATLDTHDSLFDSNKRLHSKSSLQKVVNRLPLKNASINLGGIGLEVHGIKI